MKIKRFLRRLFEPVQLWELPIYAFCVLIPFSLIAFFDPASLSEPELLELLYSLNFQPDQAIGIWGYCAAISCLILLFVALVLVNFILWLFDFFKKRRKGSDSVKDNLIQVFVDDATYDRLHLIIDGHNVSLPKFCSMVLECVDPVELEAAFEAQEV